MDLKQRKYIYNSKCLPGYTLGGWFKEQRNKLGLLSPESKLSAAGSIGGSVLLLGNNIMSNIANSHGQLTQNELAARAGSTQESIYGQTYESPRDIDENAEMAAVKDLTNAQALSSATTGIAAGASAGLGAFMLAPAAAAGPIGLGVLGLGAALGIGGGLLSKSKREREERERIRKAQLQQLNTRNQNRDVAATTGLQKKFAEEYGDLNQQMLYQAAYGKEDVNPVTNETYNNFLVDTADGKRIMKQNAWVGKNEWIQSGDKLHKVTRGHKGADDVRAHLKPSDKVYSDNVVNPETGNTIAQDVPMYAQLGELNRLLYNQGLVKQNEKEGLEMAKYGRLPKLRRGAEWWTNAIPAANLLINAWGNYNRAASLDIDQSTIIPADTTNSLIPKLYEYNINPYNTLQQLRAANTSSTDAIRRSGGLSVGQKLLAGLANYDNYYKNIANAMFSIGSKNAELKQAAVQADIANRQRREQLVMAGRDKDRANTAAAHNARQQMMNDAQYSIIDAVNNFFSNEFKRHLFNRTMDMYEGDQKLKRDYYELLFHPNRSTKPTTVAKPSYFINSTLGPIKSSTYAKYPNWPVPVMYDNRFKLYGQ